MELISNPTSPLAEKSGKWTFIEMKSTPQSRKPKVKAQCDCGRVEVIQEQSYRGGYGCTACRKKSSPVRVFMTKLYDKEVELRQPKILDLYK